MFKQLHVFLTILLIADVSGQKMLTSTDENNGANNTSTSEMNNTTNCTIDANNCTVGNESSLNESDC